MKHFICIIIPALSICVNTENVVGVIYSYISVVSRKIFYTRYVHTHQLLLWLTLNLPNLCVSVYIYLAYPGVAHARTPMSCSSCAHIMRVCACNALIMCDMQVLCE